jgi:hypothetical protein
MRRRLRRLGDVTGEELAAVEKAGASNDPERAAALLNVSVPEYRAYLKRLVPPPVASGPPLPFGSLFPARQPAPEAHQAPVPVTGFEAVRRVWLRLGDPAHTAGGVALFKVEAEKEFGRTIGQSTLERHLSKLRESKP